MRNYLMIIFLSLSIVSGYSQSMDKMWGNTSTSNNNTVVEKEKLFDDGNFGMFIHWGLFSHLGGKWKDKTYYGIGEWIKSMAEIPANEYMEPAKEFNPYEFNAKAIAKLTKDAGMKYIIITSKHHEGFAMFKSEADPFNIVDATPFARDPMKELAAACREQGLGFGFYYSHFQDWTAPGGYGGPKTHPDGTEATFEDYFYKKCLPQVIEICSNYGQIDFVWFDTPGSMKKELVVKLAEVVRAKQPNAMLCSRIGHGMGDYASKGDMEVPPRNIDGLWETCDTNNDSWSYAWYDNNFKSPKEILSRLISTVGRGGTYLFNVGPDGKGNIPGIGADFLREVGVWLSKYPQVVYGAGASPWKHALPWGDATVQGNKIFLAVYDWPVNGELWLPGLQTQIEEINLVSGDKNQKLAFTRNADWTNIKIPNNSPDDFVSIIEVSLKGEAKVDNIMAVDPVAGLHIPALFAKTVNCSVGYREWMEKFGEWKHAYNVKEWTQGSIASWDVNIKDEGIYNIDLTYMGQGRMIWEVSTDEGYTIQNQQNSSNIYARYPIGWIKFDKPGKHTISVKLLEGNTENTGLTAISVTPVRF